MRNKLFFALVLCAPAALFLASCGKSKDFKYSGSDLVEVAPRTSPIGGPVTNSVTGSYYSKRVSTASQPQDTVVVNLVGQQRTTATKVKYTIDPASTLASTDYTVVGTTGEVTIPAGASFAYIIFKFKPVTANKTLNITLTGGDNVKVSENYKTFAYDVRP